MAGSQRIHLALLSGRMMPRGDMKLMARLVRQREPRIRVTVAKARANPWTWLRSIGRPTCVVSMTPIKDRRMLRGRVLEGRRIAKSDQLSTMAAAGLPVPEWVLLTPDDDTPDVSRFGKYVVTKPVMGAQSADVRIRRTSRLRYMPPKTDTARMLGDRYGNHNQIAQRFIHTGPHPTSFRVLTLFGRRLYAVRVRAALDREALHDPESFTGGSIVSSGKGCTYDLEVDDDVIRLAERVHAAFPDVPLLGIDIVREQATGDLYVLETNPNGFTWQINARTGFKMKGFNHLDIAGEYDTYNVAADALIDAATRHAC